MNQTTLLAALRVLCLLLTATAGLSRTRSLVRCTIASCSACIPLLAMQPSIAAETRTVGNIQTSGIVFKDTLRVQAIKDPKLAGVTIFISDFDRPVRIKY